MTPDNFETLLRRAIAIPVVTLDDASLAVPLTLALLAGGLNTIEITLRTSAGIDAAAAVNGGAKRDHLGGVRRDRLAAAGLSP